MRVLHVLDHSIPLHSGYTFRTLSILREQRKLGIETFHLTTPKHTAPCGADETVDGFHFYRTRAPTGLGSRLPVMKEFALMNAVERRLREVVAIVKPDVIHAHSPALNAHPAIRVARSVGIPVVYEVRAFWEDAAVDHGTSREWGPRYRATRALETRALRQVDHVFTICEGLRQDIVSRGIADSKVTVIPNAVDVSQFQVAGVPDRALAMRLGVAGQPVIGFIGSFYAYEGLTLLVKALPQIRARVPDIRVLLVGGGPDEPELRTQVNALGLDAAVLFIGRVDHQDVKRYYDLIDVLCYPRLSMRLTELVTPLKPLEAMAQGRVFVASDVGGHKELIRDGVTGVLFKAGDDGALAQAVVDLLLTRDRWPALRTAGREFVEHERTWQSSVARYVPVYESLTRPAPVAVG